MDDLNRIIVRASRLQRLAKLKAPAIILVQAEQMLREATDRHARAMESDPDALRAELAASDIASRSEALTQEDEAELGSMEAMMAAYEAAEPVARERWVAAMLAVKGEATAFDKLWPDLDSGFRSDLIFAVMDERRPAEAAHG
jgi:hypothetical protein